MKKSRFIPFISTSPIEDIWLAVLLIPLWWVLGFRFFIFHLIVIMAFFKMLSLRKRESRSWMSFEIYALFAFVVLYIFSILMNVKNIPFPRIIGTLNNLSFWIMGGLIIILIYESADKIDLNRFLKAFPITGVFYSIFVIASFSVGFFTKRIIETESLLSRLLPDRWMEMIMSKAMLLRSSLQLVFVGEDKIFSRPFPRSPGFNVYSTALGLTMIVLIVLTFAYFRITGKRKSWPIILLQMIALLMSFSRTAIFGIVLASVIVFVLLNLRKSFFMKVVPIVLMILIVVLIIVPPKKIYDTLYDFRKGSSIWRARLYSLTLNQAVNKPILGHGFKPRTEDFPVPIGSHSTYIGLVYKTGFLGFMVFCLFWGLVLRKWWAQKRVVNEESAFYNLWIYTGIGLFSGIFWMLTEDLDAPPIAAFLFFIVVGLALSLDKLKTSPEE